MILIVGASSSVGRTAIPLLLEQGHKLRLSSRDPQKLAMFNAKNVEIVQADLLDEDSLVRACEGIDKLVISAHSLSGRGKGASKHVDAKGTSQLIDIACEKSASHCVYISILGARENSSSAFFRHKAQVEKHLRASGMSYTVLRPSAFFLPHTVLHSQAFFEPDSALKDFLNGEKATFFGKGNNPRNFVANEDVARFVVLALTDPAAANQIIEIGGPENLTIREVVGIYSKVLGKELKINSISLLIPRIMSILLKPLHPGLSDAMQLAVDADTIPTPFDVSDTIAKFPMQLTCLEDWVQNQTQRF